MPILASLSPNPDLSVSPGVKSILSFNAGMVAYEGGADVRATVTHEASQCMERTTPDRWACSISWLS